MQLQVEEREGFTVTVFLMGLHFGLVVRCRYDKRDVYYERVKEKRL
jgi:hypothetical protein